MIKKRNKTRALLSVICFFVFIIFTFTGCESYDNFKAVFVDGSEGDDDTVRIAVYETLSGPDKEQGELEKTGIEIANQLFPRALGKKVELLYFDNKSDIYIAETVVQEIVDKRVALVLGSYGSVNSLMAAGKLEAASIPAITITNTNPLVTSYNPFYFRVSYTDAFQGVALAKYTVEGLELNNAAIIKPLQDDFAAAVSKSFSSKMIQLTENEGAILDSEDYIPGEKDFSKQLNGISEAGVKVVFLPGKVKDTIEILKQADQMKLDVLFIGTDQWESEEILNLAEENSQIKIAYSVLFDKKTVSDPLSESFLSAFKDRYGANAVPESATALAFDSYIIAIDAINRAGTATDGTAVRDALQQTMQFKGVSGTISFDEHGDPIKSVAIKGITNGKTESVFTVEPKWVIQGI
ncbi:MAG: ABC transporter substrate-binding protein [Peptostreptococcaceae bacterium]|nr:ABC transporter substrate-binding protein [Peptostreptococcaceae bacterium]